MIDGLPRRVRPGAAQGVHNQLKTQRGLAGGRSKSLRPVPARPPTSVLPDDLAGLGSKDRLTLIWSTFDIVSDRGVIGSWGGYGAAALDQYGDSIQLSDSDTDDGLIYLFGEGLYCVTVQITASSGTASSDQAVAASANIRDRPNSLTIACAVRGGDPVGGTEKHAVSTTFYSEGRGLAASGIEVAVECNGPTVSADVGQVTVRVAVQKLAGF